VDSQPCSRWAPRHRPRGALKIDEDAITTLGAVADRIAGELMTLIWAIPTFEAAFAF
jgi:hypothetical protein